MASEPIAKAAANRTETQRNNAFGSRPGRTAPGILLRTENLAKEQQARRQRAERREARIDREQARPKPPFRETGVGAAFSPKNAPPGTPRVNIKY